MNWETSGPFDTECPLPWQQPSPFQQPSPICHSERSEEPAVRLDPSPIPKGKHTANSNRAYLSPDTTVSISGHILFIRSVPGFPPSRPLPATTYVVLLKENHMQPTEAATFDRKSGGADLSRRAVEGSAVFADLCWKRGILYSNKIVISPAPACRGTGAQRSGEICGFLLLLKHKSVFDSSRSNTT